MRGPSESEADELRGEEGGRYSWHLAGGEEIAIEVHDAEEAQGTVKSANEETRPYVDPQSRRLLCVEVASDEHDPRAC